MIRQAKTTNYYTEDQKKTIQGHQNLMINQENQKEEDQDKKDLKKEDHTVPVKLEGPEGGRSQRPEGPQGPQGRRPGQGPEGGRLPLSGGPQGQRPPPLPPPLAGVKCLSVVIDY